MEKPRSTKKRWIREIVAALVALVLFLLACTYAGYALMPKRTNSGAVWEDYLSEQKDTVDVLFFGSSRAYCNVIPGEIYRQSGLTSFVMAGPSQTLPVTYYYVREALKTQSPGYVFVELSGAFFHEYEEFSLANVCYMPFSANRIGAAQQCEPGILRAALFPLETFHYRFVEGNASAEPEDDPRMLCGYTPLDTAEPQTVPESRPPFVAENEAQFMENLDFLKKIAEYCGEREIEVVFFYAPTNSKPVPEDMERLQKELAAFDDVTVVFWNDLAEAMGIDPESDWYDAPHLNRSGAAKFSAVLADWMRDNGFRSAGAFDSSLWEERAAYFHD